MIFGGSGFIGTHLSNFLEKNEIEFVILDIIKPRNPKWNFVFTDIRKQIAYKPKSDKKNIIINLAAIHKTPGHQDEEYFETNLKGAENICDFAETNKILDILFTSSISVYGTYERKKSELTLPTPDIAYGISKLLAEHIHHKWKISEPKQKRRLIILRPGVVFGQYENGNFTRFVNSLQAKYFAYVGRKDVKKACIYVKDLVQAIYELSNDYKLEYDIFNVSYNPSRSISELVSIISDLGEMKFPRLVIPRFFILFCSNILFTIFNKKDFNPSRMNKLVVSNNIDSTKINQIIKFKFGFSRAISDWMLETEFKQKKKIY